MTLAFAGHAGQQRKVLNEPYIVHPMRLACDVATYNLGEVVIAAALCHDLLEDTNIEEDALRMGVGDKVADLVKLVTKWWPDNVTPDAKREFKKIYYAQIAESTDAINLKLIDRMDNMRDMRRMSGNDDWVFTYYKKTIHEFKWLLASPKCVHENIVDDFMHGVGMLYAHVREHHADVPTPHELFRSSKFVIPDGEDVDEQYEDGVWVWRTTCEEILKRVEEHIDEDKSFEKSNINPNWRSTFTLT